MHDLNVNVTLEGPTYIAKKKYRYTVLSSTERRGHLFFLRS